EDHHPGPLGALAPLAGRLVAPRIRGGDAQLDDRAAVLQAPDLRVPAGVADQNPFVHAACHGCSPLKYLFARTLVPRPAPPCRMLGLSTAAAMFAFCSTILPYLPQGQNWPTTSLEKEPSAPRH